MRTKKSNFLKSIMINTKNYFKNLAKKIMFKKKLMKF